MVRAVKRYFFNREYLKISVDGVHIEPKINSVSTMLILTDELSFDKQQLARSVEQLAKKGVNAKGFYISSTTIDEEDSVVECVDPQCFKWSGVPRQEFLVKWLQNKYDLIVKVDRHHNRSMDYLFASSNSLLKAAVVFDGQMDGNAQFCLSADSSAREVLDVLCIKLYDQLINIFK
jgi:hypothetical protein